MIDDIVDLVTYLVLTYGYVGDYVNIKQRKEIIILSNIDSHYEIYRRANSYVITRLATL
jgi:hypothetical protein